MKSTLLWMLAVVPLMLTAAPPKKAPALKDKPLEPEKVIGEALNKHIGQAAKKITKGTNHEIQSIRLWVPEKESVADTINQSIKVRRSNGKQGDVNAKLRLKYDGKNRIEAINPEVTLGKLTWRPTDVGPGAELARLNDVFERLTSLTAEVLKDHEKDVAETGTRKSAKEQSLPKERLATDLKAALDKELTDELKAKIAADIKTLSEKMKTGCAYENWRVVFEGAVGRPQGKEKVLKNYDKESQAMIKMASDTLQDIATLNVLSSTLSGFLMGTYTTISEESPAQGAAYLGLMDPLVTEFLAISGN